MKKNIWILFLFLFLINFQTSIGLDVDICGDNKCEGVETKYNCPEDCSVNFFGNAILGGTSLIFGIGFLILVISLVVFIKIKKRM